MADKAPDKKTEAPAAPPPAPADTAFRRAAGLAILGAYVQRHGGFTPHEMDAHMRNVWRYADVFVSLEHAPPLPLPEDYDVLAAMSARPANGARAVHPADEWAVYDGGRRIGGFATRGDADFYAAARPGARVVQVGGPGAEKGRVADPSVVA